MPQPPKSRKTIVGLPVHYFHGGDTTAEPCAAVIVRDLYTGVMSLSIFPANGGTPIYKKSVRHKDDAWIKTNPQVAIEDGVWDYIDGVLYTSKFPVVKAPELTTAEIKGTPHWIKSKLATVAEEAEVELSKKKKISDKLASTINVLITKGGSNAQIARSLHARGVTEEDVQAIRVAPAQV